ncbi:hypothetical protein GJ496_008641 [Pomphorhynchus laevis]|nr:hypothetical protein GJ496_008641 [Pomphorhynchus laevis]
MTYGQAPYQGMSTSEVLENVQRGYRMRKPDMCPEIMYDIMLKCWNSNAERRPTFEFLYMFFDDYFVSIQPAYNAT